MSTSYQDIKVMTHSGYRGNEKPQAFFINGKEIFVAEILDRWIEENTYDKARKRFFIVKGNDAQKYKIYIDEKTLEWFCEMHEAAL